MTPILSLYDVHKRYGVQVILAFDELRLHPGEIVHLSGRNGAGKTTLLKILAGLEPPDRAEVCDGAHRSPWNRAVKRLRRNVVYLHQRPFMFDASVEQNLAYGLRAGGTAAAEVRTRVREALRKVDLTAMAKRNARTLSGGEQQRLALARAWVLQPRVLLLDEPTANMDLEFREQTWALLQDMLDGELCMVITNHETNGPGLGPCRKVLLRDGLLTDGADLPEHSNVIRWPARTPLRREAQS